MHADNLDRSHELAVRFKQPTNHWSVYCNECDTPISNAHFHCSICDQGDYDLCERCVKAGVHCPGEDHWLIKRIIYGDSVVNSQTERIAPKAKPASDKEMPGAFTEEKKSEPEEAPLPSLTCNSCMKGELLHQWPSNAHADTYNPVFPEADFVTCTVCSNFDLCVTCHLGGRHGHHPGHAFEPVVEGSTVGAAAEALCGSGRNVPHAAICDGCDNVSLCFLLDLQPR